MNRNVRLIPDSRFPIPHTFKGYGYACPVEPIARIRRESAGYGGYVRRENPRTCGVSGVKTVTVNRESAGFGGLRRPYSAPATATPATRGRNHSYNRPYPRRSRTLPETAAGANNATKHRKNPRSETGQADLDPRINRKQTPQTPTRARPHSQRNTPAVIA